MTDTLINPEATLDQLVGVYVAIRDLLKKEDEAHAERLRPYREKLALLDTSLLARLNQIGADNVKTEHGTVYKTTVLSASIDNENEGWETLLGMIVSNALQRALQAVENGGSDRDAASAFCSSPELNFLVRGVVKTAVVEYMESHGGKVPPGVKTAQVVKLGVRRA